MTTPLIDAHHQVWDPDKGDYGWLAGPFQPIRRVFTSDDLEPALVATGITGTLLVQTWNDLGETRDFLRLADRVGFVRGVVGWVDLTAADLGSTLAELRAGPGGRWLVGVRHLIQNEDDPSWLLRSDVRRGLATLARAGLVYDLVPNLPQLPACLETVADFPELRFVLDHIAKPEIRSGGFAPWAELMQGFSAHREHVWCKLSGMVTVADWQSWTPEDLRPYVREALGIFGADRCMFGSDWPVCLVAASYDAVIEALRQCIADLDAGDRQRILGLNAIEAYRLSTEGI
jgi:L-fuconolactonase